MWKRLGRNRYREVIKIKSDGYRPGCPDADHSPPESGIPIKGKGFHDGYYQWVCPTCGASPVVYRIWNGPVPTKGGQT